MEVSSFSDIGLKRKENQDAFLVRQSPDSNKLFSLFVVADGVGGLHEGGDASKKAVSSFASWYDAYTQASGKMSLSYSKQISLIRKDWSELLESVNCEILNESMKRNAQSGTTLVALLVCGDQYLCANVGDSRLYRIGLWSMIQITEDHTLSRAQYRAGMISKREYRQYSGSDALTSCIGYGDNYKLDFINEKLYQGQVFFMCTDGIYKFIDEKLLFKIIKSDHKKSFQMVLQTIKETIFMNGAGDNLTGILIKI